VHAVTIVPQQLSFAIRSGNVVMFFGTNLVPNAVLGVEMTPAEARVVSAAIEKQARLAEKPTSQH